MEQAFGREKETEKKSREGTHSDRGSHPQSRQLQRDLVRNKQRYLTICGTMN